MKLRQRVPQNKKKKEEDIEENKEVVNPNIGTMAHYT